MEKRSVEKSVLEDVRRWANSRRAIVAVQHACIIWRLISRELQRPEATRAHFNFLAFASLHHSAVVLWTFMGACEDFTPSQQRHVVIEPLENSELVLIVNHENSEFIIASFSKIFKRTSSGGWSSFGDAALRLSTCQFPAAWSIYLWAVHQFVNLDENIDTSIGNWSLFDHKLNVWGCPLSIICERNIALNLTVYHEVVLFNLQERYVSLNLNGHRINRLLRVDFTSSIRSSSGFRFDWAWNNS